MCLYSSVCDFFTNLVVNLGPNCKLVIPSMLASSQPRTYYLRHDQNDFGLCLYEPSEHVRSGFLFCMSFAMRKF